MVETPTHTHLNVRYIRSDPIGQLGWRQRNEMGSFSACLPIIAGILWLGMTMRTGRLKSGLDQSLEERTVIDAENHRIVRALTKAYLMDCRLNLW